MVWALRDAPVTDPAAKVVLIGLANHAHADGTVAFPRISVLAAYCRCSERTVQRKLSDLLAAGVIRRGDQGYVAHLRPDRRPVVYDLDMPSRGDNLTPREPSGVTAQAERGDTGVASGVTTVSDRTVLEPSLELTTSSPYVSTSPGRGEGEQAFERFWTTYPRCERVRVTRAAWDAALRKASAEEIISAAARYAALCEGRGGEFVSPAVTWLNDERWRDRLPEPPVRFVTREERMHSEPPMDRRER